MLNRYSAIAIALFGLSIQNVSAGNEQAQRMIQPTFSAWGTPLPAALTYKPELAGHDQARALLAPVFVSGGYVGTSTSVAVDGHEQARQMIVKQ
jgi:hypothetical protein